MPKDIPADAEEISLGGFNKFVGPLYRLPDEEGRALYVFQIGPKHMNAAGTVHGGMLMAFADVAMSRTARLVTGAGTCSTVSLVCDFLRPGRLGEVVEARVRVTRKARTLVFLAAELCGETDLLLTASGTWKIGDAA
ncbi:MAG: PaaI family thioesterase [Alphaproteobacteria bacterium]|nr:PaaI family thioesterase [Alphaproteobacteria bacterium]